MKKLWYVIILLLILIGCSTKVVIPKEPVFTQSKVYTFPDGSACFDSKSFQILLNNLKLMKEYELELLKQLKER